MQRINSKQTAALITIGFRLYEQGRLQNARKIFKGLAALAPGNPYVLGILGSIHQKQSKFRDAIAQYSDALEITPGNLNLLTNRAECYLKLGKIQEAAVDLKKVIDLDKSRKHPAANRSKLLIHAVQNAIEIVKQKGINSFLQKG